MYLLLKVVCKVEVEVVHVYRNKEQRLHCVLYTQQDQTTVYVGIQSPCHLHKYSLLCCSLSLSSSSQLTSTVAIYT